MSVENGNSFETGRALACKVLVISCFKMLRLITKSGCITNCSFVELRLLKKMFLKFILSLSLSLKWWRGFFGVFEFGWLGCRLCWWRRWLHILVSIFLLFSLVFNFIVHLFLTRNIEHTLWWHSLVEFRIRMSLLTCNSISTRI